MTQVTETAAELFAQILDPANRPDPYPLYARLRETPVAPLADGFFAVSRYAEIAALLHDPRMSKDQRKTEIPLVGAQRLEPRPFLFLDPPEHDRLRRLVMRPVHPGPRQRPARPHRRPRRRAARCPSRPEPSRRRRRSRLPAAGHGHLRATRRAARGRVALPRLGRHPRSQPSTRTRARRPTRRRCRLGWSSGTTCKSSSPNGAPIREMISSPDSPSARTRLGGWTTPTS